MSKDLFSLLINHAQRDSVVIADSDKGRFIERESEDDAKLMSEANVESLHVGRNVRLVKVIDNNDLYFCIFGLSDPDPIPEGMELVSLTPALFAISILESRIQPNVSGLDIKNAIELDYIGSPDYNGHELQIITALFPRATVYKGSINFEFHLNLHRVFGAFYCRTSLDRPIDIELTTLSSLANFFESSSKFIPFDNIARGLVASSYESLFLESYRCLEQIYSCTKVERLRREWNSTQSLRKLSALLENHLAWRPKEDEALLLILESCNLTTVQDVCIILKLSLEKIEVRGGQSEARPKTDSELVKTAASGVYSLRNQLVHYRPVHEAPQKSDIEWNELIRLMLIFISESYDTFGEIFFSDLPTLATATTTASATITLNSPPTQTPPPTPPEETV